ncbi:tRNA lysidine(34) synthetase TilS [Paenibacillus gansuensis]|uniref:tRNA(Ile)-lysidine synthase n=1 Tax=Paenibacillus gansuensis TaxID=306542 RepID=A0ABW5P964_9BACL
MEGLLRKVDNIIREEGLACEGQALLVAVSGGPDSVALLHLLHRLSAAWKFRLYAAHVNHQFRGSESDEEEDFVRKIAEDLGVPCETVRINVPAYIEESGLNLQTAARQKRYEFLHKTAVAFGASAIVTAHHADDQAETVLMRIIRGTGSGGLAGIPIRRREKNVELIRPLLRIYKSEILQYLQNLRIPYRNDSSNELRKYTRNRIRLDVLPYLSRLNPHLPDSLNRLAETAAAEEEYMEGETLAVYERIVRHEGDRFTFSGRDFASLHLALQRRVIKLILSYLAPGGDVSDFQKIEGIRHAVTLNRTSSIRIDLDRMIEFKKEYDRCSLGPPADSSPASYAYEVLQAPFRLEIPEFTSWLSGSLIPGSEPAYGHSALQAHFDAEEIVFPLMVRNRRSGDRMQIAGLNGSKKVKDIFIDDKIYPVIRDEIPIILDGNHNILWIPGIRVSGLAQVRPDTARTLSLTLEKSGQVREWKHK